MPALMTHTDRLIHRLRNEIERNERWLAAERSDRRAVAFFKDRLRDLRKELSELQEREQ